MAGAAGPLARWTDWRATDSLWTGRVRTYENCGRTRGNHSNTNHSVRLRPILIQNGECHKRAQSSAVSMVQHGRGGFQINNL